MATYGYSSARSIVTPLMLQGLLSISASEGLSATLFGALAFLVCHCRILSGSPMG